MSELTVTAMRFGILALLWAFVFSIVGVMRGDLYGARVVSRGTGRNARVASREQAARPARARRNSLSHLAVIEGSMRGITLPLSEGGILIGRNPECTLVLTDDFASGRHARIYAEGDQWFLDDLGSTNGTFVGHQRVGEHVPIGEGARIRIGTTVLEMRK
ncbi:FHA domain-containing protein [Calidifontibacter sp. DB0510]|uniref:FHA domain-containing protein n=1 Tax=Metallococcus carri TaxID=1656884 RepID=A0A967AZU6_9MICO|nr:FHA domain-containing protein [Metallococcus carri]NHN56166.1 FHA domain-containing protein [Metallococcus carri]NOP38783.1 FHA domain-containing protein [Calidifontibacter sp. DB2511S]